MKCCICKKEIEKQYRLLISKNHPDKLIGQKKSEQEIKEANKKTQMIRDAFNIIKKENK